MYTICYTAYLIAHCNSTNIIPSASFCNLCVSHLSLLFMSNIYSHNRYSGSSYNSPCASVCVFMCVCVCVYVCVYVCVCVKISLRHFVFKDSQSVDMYVNICICIM
eukprot:GHVQ01026348.1.p3 GENE.GHVQ01026348.1~~GHVQ01026348.1.p3  ORF type:complete len:106 (+),score=16.48 GHVQ01026348.1:525-842(+)